MPGARPTAAPPQPRSALLPAVPAPACAASTRPRFPRVRTAAVTTGPWPPLRVVPAPVAPVGPEAIAPARTPLRLVTPPTARAVVRLVGSTRGQASVELVAVLPLVAVALALAYQALLAGQAVWEVRVAARAAARANAFGADAAGAGRAHLRRTLERRLQGPPGGGGDGA